MNEILPFIVAGIATGAVYGLAASGLVLTYRTSGIFNFGHGATAALAAYLYYYLTTDIGLGWIPSVVLSVGVLGPAIGLVFELMSRKLVIRSSAMRVVGTVGVILVVEGLAGLKFGPDPLTVPQFLPGANSVFRLFGVNITYGQTIVTAISVLCVLALYGLVQFTRTGIAMRSVVDDPNLVSLHGTNPQRVRRQAWIIGSTFAALSGVLLAPTVGVDVVVLTYLVVQAMGAAAIGRFRNIWLTFIGGILLGILTDLSTKYVLDASWLSGLPNSIPFIVLIGVMLLTPRNRLPIQREPAGVTAHDGWIAPDWAKLGAGVALIGILVLLPNLDSSNIPLFTEGICEGLLLLSLGLLVRTSGQISLAHAAFAGLGAITFSQLIINLGLPWLVAVAAAAAIVALIGILVALTAIRLSPLFLALATLAFSLLVEQLIYPLNIGFTTLSQGRVMPRPAGFGSNLSYYYLALAFLIGCSILMLIIHRSRLGRMLRGMGDSSVALPAMGLNTGTTKVIVFFISAYVAAIAGILYGCSVHYAVASDSNFMSFQSMMLLALLALAPFRSPWYAIFGVIPFVIQAYVNSPDVTYWLSALFGVLAIHVAMRGGTPSMPSRLRTVLDRLPSGRLPWTKAPPVGTPIPTPDPVRTPVVTRPTSQGLSVSDLQVKFGGVTAVDDLSLDAPIGRVTGLIGPNGAGKTTTFNACCGYNRNVSGVVEFRGASVARLGIARRSRTGIGRTFQVAELCDSMTVFDNVALGREAGMAGSHLISQLLATKSERRVVERAVRESMELCEINEIQGVQVGRLSTGQRRIVELARVLAGPFEMLLLDEPSSGLDQDETAHFAGILERIVDQRGVGVLLVEHDMSLIRRVCDYIYVMDFGRLIAQGAVSDVLTDPLVKAAYLGADAAVGGPSDVR